MYRTYLRRLSFRRIAEVYLPKKMEPLSHINESLRSLAVEVSSLTPDPRNARKHSARNLDAIKASLDAFGQQKPVVITSDGVVVAGNGLVEAARALGWSHVAAVKVEAEHAKAYGIADNRTAELSSWDTEVLRELLTELPSLDSVGFTEAELKALVDEWEPGTHDISSDDEYDETDETYNIKVSGVSFEDKERAVEAINDALAANNLPYKAEAF